MSAIAGFRGPVNGGVALPPPEANELLQYRKILELRDQVFTGSHPRLTVPAHAIRKVSPRYTQPPPKSQLAVSTPVSIAPPLKLPGLQLSSATDQPPPDIPLPNGSSIVPRSYPPNPSASELDPIFLTKSDHLVSAEMQLQRQRLERILREQLDQKRTELRHKTSLQEAKPDFDISDVLTRALEIARPVTFEDPRGMNDNASASDSFDENSFYSSKAPDSTPRNAAELQSPSSKHQVAHVDMDDLDADGAADHSSNEARQIDLPDSPYKINPRPVYQAPLNHQPSYNLRQDIGTSHNDGAAFGAMDLDEDDEEAEYSPPEPAEQYLEKDTGKYSSKNQTQEQGRYSNGRHSDRYMSGRRYDSPPESDYRIVRSHITSPIAPQPSRVSPLALAKAPPILQNPRPRQDQFQQQRMGRPESVRTSPDVFVQTVQPRKRRKLEARKARRKAATSPEPNIKDEPVSPPPFHDVQPLGMARPRQGLDKPIYIDVDPPREVRYVPAPERQTEYSPRPVNYDFGLPVPQTEPRPYSRSGLHDMGREEHNLRKVASMQNMRAEYPREYQEPTFQTPSRLSRAPSYAVLESPARADTIRTYQEPAQPYERPLVREERIVRSPAYSDREPPSHYYSQPMAPPQRRIVVDQNGNQFYEIMQPKRVSAAPPAPAPVSRYVDVEHHHEGASLRNGSVRATSVFEEPYRERRYVQEMPPPPQISYRRVTDVARNPVVESRPVHNHQLDPRHIQRSASVQVVDYAPQQPIYVDDRDASRDVVRMSSARPPMARYEEPRGVVQRVQSVRPGGREVSVFVDDRPQVRREYVQMEPPAYEMRRTARDDGYYEVEDGGRMVLDGAVEGRPSVARRH